MRVEITVSMDPFVNTALDGSQTGMSLLRSVRVVNNGDAITNGHLRVVTQPFITEFSNPVDLHIPENGTVDVDVSDLVDVNPLHLLDLPDSYISKLKIVLYTGDNDVVAESDVYNVKLLTCNTWPGCPDRDLLSAFVVPTQPSLVKDVGPLRRSAPNSSPEEVAIAIVKLLRKRKLSKTEIPGNLFKRPFRFMMYEEMPAFDQCTPVDMALAFAAMTEAMGLNPVIGVFEKGFMTGMMDSSGKGWDSVTPVDPDLIFGGCQPKDIVSKSRRSDKGALDTLVDVSALRKRIPAIPYRLMEHGMRTYVSLEDVRERSLPLRYMGWMSRLLDISLNNSLLNMGDRVAKVNIRDTDDLGILQDSLIMGNEIRTRFTGDDGKGMLRENRIPIDPSDRTVMESIRQSITANIRDTGIGGGSLGLGVVTWRDAKNKRHEAPLVLVSVDLKKLNEHSYSLKHPDMEDAMVNIVLLERLRSEKGMRMPRITDLSENGRVDIGRLVSRILEVPGTEYSPSVVFGEFGLETNAMWRDLESNSSTILSNPIVDRLSKGEDLDSTGFLEPDYGMNDLRPVLPVDSSQIAAMNAAVSGRSFVIRGPPGTGKSQTICNIICELLRRGRTVLFVSQKASALEIIDRRLTGMGLGDHCIGIYGKKARRSSVMEQLRRAVDRCRNTEPLEEMAPLAVETDALDKYYEAMFGGSGNRESFYGTYNRYLASLSGPDLLPEPDQSARRAFGEDVTALDSLISDIPEDGLLSVFPPSDFSTEMLTGDVRVNATALRKALKQCSELYEILRVNGLGGEITVGEVESLTGDLAELNDMGLKPSDMEEFMERVHRAGELDDVIWKCCEYVPFLTAETNREELLKTMGLLRDVLSELDSLRPGSDGLHGTLESIEGLIDDVDELVPEESWGEFVKGYDSAPVRMAEEIRGSGISPTSFGGMLHVTSDFLDMAYPGMGTNPFRVSNTIRHYDTITRKWDSRISTDEFREAVSSLRRVMDDIDSIITRIRGDIADWRECKGIGQDYLWFNGWFEEAVENRVLSSMFDLQGFRRSVTSVIASASKYNSALKSSDAFWKPAIYPSAEDYIKSWEQMDDHKLMNRLNGNRSNFMKLIENQSRYRMRFNEVRGRLELARDTVEGRRSLNQSLAACEQVLSSLKDRISELERLADEVEKAQKALPDWRRLQSDGMLDDEENRTALENLCLDIRSTLKDMGVSSRNIASMDFGQLSRLCDRLEYEMGSQERYSTVHGRCMDATRTIPDATESIIGDIDAIGERMSRVNPEVTGIPVGCALMIQRNSKEISGIVSSCRTALEHYDSVVSPELRSDVLNISEIRDRLELMKPRLKDIQGMQRFTAGLTAGGADFMESVTGILGRHPREDVVKSLERRFLRSILDSEMGKAFGIEDYGRGKLNEYEEMVRRAYDRMYGRNRVSLAESLTNRASAMSSDPLLDRLSSKDEPLSDVLDSISHLLPSLTPCFMMNVQSVSRFLGNSNLTFDYVIFDESSQIPVADAISSISKGDACIIVGDTNQLPPTRFFKNNINDQNEGETESILEECIFKGMPSLGLEWHYRSNHESLIAYSNSRFYDNRLITFPSVTDRTSMVEFRHVKNGVYARGEGRNENEAEAVVSEIYEICADPANMGRSIGVITFGTSQKEAIEEALARRQRSKALGYTNRREPLFVGNLESIQGEERSIILISVGYGRDADGRLSLNFGPINQGRGWRRLNVAISRARDRMIVFSSMCPSEIRINKNTGRGVRELRGFLEYAENGSFERKVTSADIIDPILPDVAKVVEDMGYETSLNIGKSELRIDVAVVDPGNPDRYCLAILLDRNLHDNSRNPVDRDYTKVRFLKKMGWRVLRVHTIDWMMDREYTVERIKDALPPKN